MLKQVFMNVGVLDSNLDFANPNDSRVLYKIMKRELN